MTLATKISNIFKLNTNDKEEGLYTIAYVSKIVVDQNTDYHQIKKFTEKIATECLDKNKKNDITGLLYYGNYTFFQRLEGKKRDVEETLKRICKDSRHKEVTVIQSKEIKKRMFAKWSMKFISNRYYIDNLFQQIVVYGFEYGELNKNYTVKLNTLLKIL